MNDDDDRIGESDQQTDFLRYFAKDHQRIFGYIFSLLHNRADAEDVFQQTSVVLWRRFDEFDREREFYPWACGVAFFTSRNFLRTSGRSRLQFSDDLLRTLSDERIVADPGMRKTVDKLDTCISQLGERDQDLIRRVYGQDQTVSEIADSLGRATQTLYNRMNLIRRRLAECMKRPAIDG